MFLILLCAVFLGVWFYWYVQWKHYTKYLKGITWDTPLPIVGHALRFKDNSDVITVLQDVTQRHNGIAPMMIGNSMFIIITDYKLMETMLSSTQHITKARAYSFLWRWLGFGLLTSTGQKWKQRRRVITPSYHFQILEQFIDVFNSNSNVLVKQLEKESGKGSTDIYPYVTLCTLDIICETAMGTSVNAQVESDATYVQSVKEISKIVMDRVFAPFQQYDLFYYFSSNYRREKKCLKVLHDYTRSVIKSRRQALVGNVDSNKSADDLGIKKRMAFLDMLLQASIDGQPLSDEDIREEVDTFMFEGHDTTSAAISFALYCIANHRDVQEKILEEQRHIFGDEKSPNCTYRDLQEMRYLEMVIKETLRLYPSVPFFARKLEEDFEYNGSVFKKGITMTFTVFALHRDPKFYENPDRFDPERFSDENKNKIPPYAYVPFSAGPRNCIGQKFAMLEMKSTISNVVRNYELSPVVPAHHPNLLGELIIKSANGILMKLKKRN